MGESLKIKKRPLLQAIGAQCRRQSPSHLQDVNLHQVNLAQKASTTIIYDDDKESVTR
ncbi:hypothetical protein [Scytonema sp. PCC 10023]|uniref:hypothetical protein n=1 Tax=Scytonema sp. PCC 10023 TaxID=1680591 RepID=UPI0039C70481